MLFIGVIIKNNLTAGLEAQVLQFIYIVELFALLKYMRDLDLPLLERTWDSEIITKLEDTVPEGINGAVQNIYWAKRATFSIF